LYERRKKALESMKCIVSWEEPIPQGDLVNTNLDGLKTLVNEEAIPPDCCKQRRPRMWGEIRMIVEDAYFWDQEDLQVLIEPRDESASRRIHFHTISTNEVHPKAALPCIDIHQADCSIWEHCYMVAYEDRVALVFGKERPRNGAALVCGSMESKILMPYMLVSDIAFLSRDEALLFFNGQGNHGVSIAIYSFQLQQITCECQLPFSKLPTSVLFLHRPNSHFVADCPSSITTSLLPDPEVDIIAMVFRLEDSVLYSSCCVLSVRLFRQICDSLLQKILDRKVFRWKEWGPRVTRWLPYQGLEPAGNQNSFGSRMIARGWPMDLHSESYRDQCLLLLDFNPRPIKLGATTCLTKETHVIVVNKETTWKHPYDGTMITSSLPYRAFTRLWYPCAWFRFDGSTLINGGVSPLSQYNIIQPYDLTCFASQRSAYHCYSFLPLVPNAEKGRTELLEWFVSSTYMRPTLSQKWGKKGSKIKNGVSISSRQLVRASVQHSDIMFVTLPQPWIDGQRTSEAQP
ncbi:11917_t:CDS:2, partial [Acaulospora colombiana]